MFVGRENELKWLDVGRRLGQTMIIEGLSGVGKTTLIEEWLKTRELHAKWIRIQEFESLRQKSAIDAMDSLAQKGTLEIIVWDNVQLLSHDDMMFLLAHIDQDRARHHLIIANNKMKNIPSVKFSKLLVKPFVKNEIVEFCHIHNKKVDGLELKKMCEISGGLPALLNLWLHTNEGTEFAFENLLHGPSRYYHDVLVLMAASLIPLTLNQIRSIIPELSEEIEWLLERFIIVKMNNGYIMPASFREFIWQKINKTDKIAAHQKLACYFEPKQNQHNPLAHAYHTILSGDEEKSAQVLTASSIDIWESLNSELLHSLLAGLENLDSTVNSSTPFYRTKLRLLFLLGRRNEAALAAQEILSHFKQMTSEPEILLAAECLQYCNRINNYGYVIDKSPQILRRASGLSRAMIYVEWGVALHVGRGDFEAALRQFELAIQFTNSERDKNSKAGQQILGTAYFEMARVFDIKNQFEIAKLNYRQSVDYFTKCEKKYFASVGFLNLAWVALKTQNWDDLSHYQKAASALASEYGFEYVKAGLLLIEAMHESLNIRFGRALQLTEECLSLLGDEAPPATKIDVLTERMRILNLMGLVDEAKRTFTNIEKIVSQNRLTAWEAHLTSLQIELEFSSMDREEWVEKFNGIYTQDKLSLMQLHFLVYMGVEVDPSQLMALRSFPLGALRILEAELISLKDKTWSHLWPIINAMEKILLQSKEVCGEWIALAILRSHLRESDYERENDLRQARTDLTRWGCDLALKKPLELCLKAAENRISPQKLSEWSACWAGQQDRWSEWFRGVQDAKNEDLERVTNTNLPAEQMKLYVNEPMDEVLVDNKPCKTLSRSSSLRNLLILLLEGNPKILSKNQLVKLLWNESYNPSIHDSRIYTSIQRLRSCIRGRDAIQSWERGYRWNNKYGFLLERKKSSEFNANNRVQLLILRALSQKANPAPLTRSELVHISESSDATVKRELAKLLEKKQIYRHGRGRVTTYSLNPIGSIL